MAAKVLACGGAAKKVCALLNEHGYAAHAVREYEAERAEGIDAVILLPPVAEGGTISAAEALVRQGVAVLCVGAEPPEGSGAVFLKSPYLRQCCCRRLRLHWKCAPVCARWKGRTSG